MISFELPKLRMQTLFALLSFAIALAIATTALAPRCFGNDSKNDPPPRSNVIEINFHRLRTPQSRQSHHSTEIPSALAIADLVRNLTFNHDHTLAKVRIIDLIERILDPIAQGQVYIDDYHTQVSLALIEGITLLLENPRVQDFRFRTRLELTTQSLFQFMQMQLRYSPSLEIKEVTFFAESIATLVPTLDIRLVPSVYKILEHKFNGYTIVARQKHLNTTSWYQYQKLEQALVRINYQICRSQLERQL